jgi:hypothetical protein
MSVAAARRHHILDDADAYKDAAYEMRGELEEAADAEQRV